MTDLWSRLDAIIEELASVTDIRAAAVVRRDGLIITHTLPDGVDPKIVAAMVSIMHDLARSMTAFGILSKVSPTANSASMRAATVIYPSPFLPECTPEKICARRLSFFP